MPKLAWINGTIHPLEKATVSIADHAHLYGDGLFEGIRFYNKKVFKLDEHLDRLYHGIAYSGIEMPFSQAELRSHVLATCKEADLDAGYIRLNVTRGTGLGLDPANINRTANVVIMINTIALYPESAYQNGLTAVTTSFRVIPSDTLDPRLKCIGRYASNILAKMEANRAGAGEGLLLNHQGQIAECTGDNIFFVIGGKLVTPHPSCGILDGITRRAAIAIAKGMGVTVEETVLTPYDTFTATEAFLTGTAAEVIPLVSLDARPIGNGKIGDLTLKIMAKFKEETQNGVPF